MEFYNTKTQEIFYNNIYKKPTKFEVENEKGTLIEVEGEDTLFLDKLSDSELKELGIARVERGEELEPNAYQEAKEQGKYEESKNLYTITYFLEDKPLETLKEIKTLEIDSKKEEAINAGCEYKGKVYQCSTSDQTLILGRISQAQATTQAGVETQSQSIAWIAKDNTITSFSLQEFMGLGVAIANYIEQITFKARTLKDKVAEAKSTEEVKAIVWES